MFLTGDPFNEQIAVRRNIPVIVNRKDGYHNDKGDYVDEICNQFNCTSNEVAYFGDDLFDVGIMKKVKYPFSLNNLKTLDTCLHLDWLVQISIAQTLQPIILISRRANFVYHYLYFNLLPIRYNWYCLVYP